MKDRKAAGSSREAESLRWALKVGQVLGRWKGGMAFWRKAVLAAKVSRPLLGDNIT